MVCDSIDLPTSLFLNMAQQALDEFSPSLLFLMQFELNCLLSTVCYITFSWNFLVMTETQVTLPNFCSELKHNSP